MKNRTIGKCLLSVCCFFLVWSGNSPQLWAGQNYQRHVTVFGNSSAAATTPRAVNPATQADIRQMMDLVGTKATVMRVMKTTESNMRPLLFHALPPGPYRQRLVELFIEKFNSEATPQHIMGLAVPIYAQYLSDDEIKGLIQFYKTPLGQKWISIQPKVQAALLPEAQAWGRELGRRTMMEVLQENPDLAQQLKAAARAAHRP